MLSKILLGIILILNVQCLFEKAKYITHFSDVNKLDKKLNTEGKISLILIYSDSCPHCRRFEPDFIRLSETFNNYFSFYVMSSKTNYKSKFKIRGVPTMFFFDGSKYIEHKGGNNYDTISYILENDYSKKCLEIDLEYLIDMKTKLKEKGNKYEHNYILGYFPKEDNNNEKEGNNEIQNLITKKTLESFLNNTHKLIGLMDNCYYIRNLNNNLNNEEKEQDDDLINDLPKGTVLIFSENKGINIFREYNTLFISNEELDKDYYIKRIQDIGEVYKKFLNEKIIDYYIDITDSKMINQLSLFVKRNILLFVYKNDEQKSDYKRIINILIGMTKNDKYPLFDFVLFKYGCNLYSLSYFIKDSGIYYVDKNLNKISKTIDLSVIVNMINTQNEYEFNPEDISKEENSDTNITTNNQTNNISEQKDEELYYNKLRENIIEKQLINYLNNRIDESLLDSKSINSVLCFLICLIMYSLIFDYIYQNIFHGKSIFNIFNECIHFIKVSCCDYEDDDIMESNEIKIKNKKIDDINEEKSNKLEIST